MSNDPAIMLRQLGQGGRANAAQLTPVAPAAPAGGVQAGEFADLLRRARDGSLSSNRPVTVADDAGLKLSEDQLARLALAADRAEAAGLRKVLVTIDEQRVILDIPQRTVLSAAGGQGSMIEGIDGVIDLAGLLAPAPDKAAPLGPPTAMESPAVARLLSQLNQRDRAA